MPVSVSTPNASPMPEPVDEAVHGEAERPGHADLMVRARLLGVVAVVQDEHALEQEEAEEPGADQQPDLVGVSEQLHRLRADVEERDRDDDAAR